MIDLSALSVADWHPTHRALYDDVLSGGASHEQAVKAVQLIASRYGGQVVYIPTGRSYRCRARNRRIRATVAASSNPAAAIKTLARECKITHKTVAEICRCSGKS